LRVEDLSVKSGGAVVRGSGSTWNFEESGLGDGGDVVDASAAAAEEEMVAGGGVSDAPAAELECRYGDLGDLRIADQDDGRIDGGRRRRLAIGIDEAFPEELKIGGL
jgi:hypothetical protein